MCTLYTHTSSLQDKTIIEWDMLRNQQRKQLEGHSGPVLSMCTNKDGTKVWFSSYFACSATFSLHFLSFALSSLHLCP